MKHLALALCLSLLYLGYELARAASIALFAGGSAGWSGVFAACGGFVLTFATLELYGRSVELLGPTFTLVLSSTMCSAVFVLCAAGLLALQEDSVTWWSLVASLYAFREAYVTLIGTQIWALLSTDLRDKGANKSKRWICVIQVSLIVPSIAITFYKSFPQGLVTGRSETDDTQVRTIAGSVERTHDEAYVKVVRLTQQICNSYGTMQHVERIAWTYARGDVIASRVYQISIHAGIVLLSRTDWSS